MLETGLTEKEKESLIKYLCTQGKLVLKDNHKVFEFFGDIDVEGQFTAGYLLEKAFNNIEKQLRGIE